ncbi:hypothetical protein [Blastopirellula marina]|uniref:Uncharacterized protein n=1 Tax=Blastopirellula marina TaxID=124 RepID=A0A2S8F7M6_9BACT|nr:hypothetical protein [Blastopirellula marina]PQO28161.1 hypothetical protein C5Y98_24975 [Blastopirellula marina]PTL41701.1 hypothetical protein C5Y97_24990 [Blastopirellula marina]
MVRIIRQFVAIGFLAASPALLWAGSPVQFDIGYLTPAQDITTPEFQRQRPGYRLMKLDVMISTMVDSRISKDLTETTFLIEPHNPSIQIEDFSPQTTLQSPYAGNISQEKRVEYNVDGKLTANQTITPNLGGGGSLGISRKQSSVEKVDVIPEMKLVSASGTIHRGRGVYFRFNRTPQTSLEGTTVLGVILAVPDGWTADTMTVRCRAKVRQPIVPGGPSKENAIPESHYTVAMYVAGDRYAADAASRYVREEAHWQEVRQKYGDEIQRRRIDSPLDYLTSIVHPSQRNGSVEQWLRTSPEKASRELPPPVVDAYYRLQEARAHLDRCSGVRALNKARVTDESAIANSAVSVN